jgi:hypothetical protein
VKRHLLIVALAALPVLGCGASYIRNTTVEDSDGNRRVLAFCEKYRRALETRNRAELLAMASTRYYEDGGTPTASDDYDYAGLRQVLEERFQQVRQVRFDIRYRDISTEEGEIHVDFTYSASFQMATPLGDRWYRKVEDNRLVLRPLPRGEGYRILSGM